MGKIRSGGKALAVVMGTALSIGVLSACSNSETNGASDSSAEEINLTIDNCGFELNFSTVPQRTVTLEQASTDTLFALGVADHIAGTSNQKTPVLPEYAEAYNKIPVLAEKPLTSEQLRSADPDFVVSPFESFFTADNVGTREELKELGVNSYVSNVECRDYKDNKGKTAFELIAKDLEELGKIYAVESRAKELIAEQETAIKAAENKGKGTSILYLYSLYKGTPYVAGNTGVGQAISDITGSKNVMEKVNDLWPEVGWEAIADLNPDVIVIGDLKERGAPGDSYEDKIEAMKADPVMSKLDAVKNERFIIVPGVELDATVRAAHALTVISDELQSGIATKTS